MSSHDEDLKQLVYGFISPEEAKELVEDHI
jgi:hypothetical protein